MKSGARVVLPGSVIRCDAILMLMLMLMLHAEIPSTQQLSPFL